MLFGNSDGQYIQGEDLDYKTCFELLLDAPEGNHVIYGGDYDVIMMTKTMPIKVLDRLLHGKPVRHDGYRMQWFRKKYLTLSDGERRIILYDVMTFFGTSFVKACIEYLGDDEVLQEMQAMKLRRSDFTMDDPTVIPYWQSELKYLVDLMNELRRLLHKVGIQPKGWHGPGAVASALLSAHNVGQYIDEQPEEIIDLAERAYYGGRFEQFKVGSVKEVHEYDIRSAYPTAIEQLPSLKNVVWTHHESCSNDEKFHLFGLYCVSWNIEDAVFPPIGIPGPLPWRSTHGNIYYPSRGYKSWYWGVEVQNLFHFPSSCYTIHEAYVPTAGGHGRPFRWVRDMYDQRAAMKAVGNPAQLAVKLGLNSLYGKLAQSKGAKKKEDGWKKPRWHTVIYAGWITAFTRRRMFEALIKSGQNTIAVETDAIFSEVPLDLTEGVGLGEWEHTTMEQILYVHSGVYYALQNGVWKLKSRGMEVDRSQSADYWMEIFSRLPHEQIEVTASIRRFGTLIGSSHYANWYDFKRSTVLPSLKSKRIHYPPYCIACQNDRSSNYANIAHNLSVPDPVLDSDISKSTPYPFPWRPDIKFSWPTEWVVREVDEPMEVSWQ
jgi:hypothetical protein